MILTCHICRATITYRSKNLGCLNYDLSKELNLRISIYILISELRSVEIKFSPTPVQKMSFWSALELETVKENVESSHANIGKRVNKK